MHVLCSLIKGVKAIEQFMVIPLKVAHDEDLPPNAKLLYGEILSLSQKTGVCFAKNSYFADLYKISPETISRLIKKMTDKNFISSEVKFSENRVASRAIVPLIKISNHLEKKVNPPLIKKASPLDKKVKDNSISNNIRLISTTVVPTENEIFKYCEGKAYSFDIAKFMEYNENQNWKLGNGRFEDWKEACDYWHKTERPKKEKAREDNSYEIEILRNRRRG